MKRRLGSYSALFYHFVWTTKNRVPAIDEQIEMALRNVFSAKAKELDLEIVETNGTQDHVHVLTRSNPTLAPADIAKHLKGSSSHFVNHVTLKNDKIRSLYWQDGYGVTSVSPGAVGSVRKYIREQKEHHKENKLQDDLEVSSRPVDGGIG